MTTRDEQTAMLSVLQGLHVAAGERSGALVFTGPEGPIGTLFFELGRLCFGTKVDGAGALLDDLSARMPSPISRAGLRDALRGTTDEFPAAALREVLLGHTAETLRDLADRLSRGAATTRWLSHAGCYSARFRFGAAELLARAVGEGPVDPEVAGLLRRMVPVEAQGIAVRSDGARAGLLIASAGGAGSAELVSDLLDRVAAFRGLDLVAGERPRAAAARLPDGAAVVTFAMGDHHFAVRFPDGRLLALELASVLGTLRLIERRGRLAGAAEGQEAVA